MNEKDRNTSTKPRLVTAEAVRAGHPDKFCDQFADMLLDEHLKGDPGTRAAIEVMATDAKILVAGEVTSKASVDVEPILKQLCAKVGYTMEELSTGGELALEVRLNRQSPDIAQAVVDGEDLGAGDQGIMVGYATDETPERMPLPVVLAQGICRGLDERPHPVAEAGRQGASDGRVSGRCARGREHSGGLRAARRGCAGGNHPQGS